MWPNVNTVSPQSDTERELANPASGIDKLHSAQTIDKFMSTYLRCILQQQKGCCFCPAITSKGTRRFSSLWAVLYKGLYYCVVTPVYSSSVASCVNCGKKTRNHNFLPLKCEYVERKHSLNPCTKAYFDRTISAFPQANLAAINIVLVNRASHALKTWGAFSRSLPHRHYLANYHRVFACLMERKDRLDRDRGWFFTSTLIFLVKNHYH